MFFRSSPPPPTDQVKRKLKVLLRLRVHVWKCAHQSKPDIMCFRLAADMETSARERAWHWLVSVKLFVCRTHWHHLWRSIATRRGRRWWHWARQPLDSGLLRGCCSEIDCQQGRYAVCITNVGCSCWLSCGSTRCCVTVARKRSPSFCQKCRWQVTAKHAYTLPVWLWMKWHCNLVHGWMVYTELAPKWQHFTWHQPCNNHRALPVHHFRGY